MFSYLSSASCFHIYHPPFVKGGSGGILETDDFLFIIPPLEKGVKGDFKKNASLRSDDRKETGLPTIHKISPDPSLLKRGINHWFLPISKRGLIH